MQTNATADDRPVATALSGVIVRGEQNLLAESAEPGAEGARAALETFYYAFNTRSLELYQRIWADDPLVQLGSPVGGMVRGSATIAALATRMFSGSLRVQTMLEDIVVYATPDLVVFTGSERGAYTHENERHDNERHDNERHENERHDNEREAAPELPAIRSICIFRFIGTQGGWRLVYHHVSCDDADQLAQYQRAVRGA